MRGSVYESGVKGLLWVRVVGCDMRGSIYERECIWERGKGVAMSKSGWMRYEREQIWEVTLLDVRGVLRQCMKCNHLLVPLLALSSDQTTLAPTQRPTRKHWTLFVLTTSILRYPNTQGMMRSCSVQIYRCFSSFHIAAIRSVRDVQGIVCASLLPDNSIET